MREEAVAFGEENSLVGIVTNPSPVAIRRSPLGVLLLNPGLVHRVGPGRIYVKIARALAAKGFLSLRFDFSGIGDSGARHDQLSFEKSSVSEAGEAMNFLKATRGIDHFILVGGCSGAVVSLAAAGCDPRVRHAILINFPVQDEKPEAGVRQLDRAKAHYYWNFAFFNPRSWRKFLTGKADYRRIFGALGSHLRRWLTSRSQSPPGDTKFAHELRAVTGRGVFLTFVCSQGDPALADLRRAGGAELERLCASRHVALEIIPRSDHTFSSLHDQERLVKVLVKRCSDSIQERVEPALPVPSVCIAESSSAQRFH